MSDDAFFSSVSDTYCICTHCIVVLHICAYCLFDRKCWSDLLTAALWTHGWLASLLTCCGQGQALWPPCKVKLTDHRVRARHAMLVTTAFPVKEWWEKHLFSASKETWGIWIRWLNSVLSDAAVLLLYLLIPYVCLTFSVSVLPSSPMIYRFSSAISFYIKRGLPVPKTETDEKEGRRRRFRAALGDRMRFRWPLRCGISDSRASYLYIAAVNKLKRQIRDATDHWVILGGFHVRVS